MRVAWIAVPVAGMAALVGALAWSAPEDGSRGDVYRQLELFAEGPTRFFLRAVDAQLEFQTDASGAVTGLVLVQNGARQPARKRAATPPPRAP